MTPNLLNYLCEPITKKPMRLADAVTTTDGTIESGTLVTLTGTRYPIINGIPRFVDYVGSHQFQHHKSDDEIRALLKSMQDAAKVGNMDKYFLRPLHRLAVLCGCRDDFR